MIGTAFSKDHALWGQIVNKESETRKRFEYLTGETQAKKFFNGTMKTGVDAKLETFDGQFQAHKRQ